MTQPPSPHAVLLWTDETYIYAELPQTGGGFYRLSLPYNGLGLAKALNLLRDHRPTARPPSTPPAPRPPKGYTPAQVKSAIAILGKVKK